MISGDENNCLLYLQLQFFKIETKQRNIRANINGQAGIRINCLFELSINIHLYYDRHSRGGSNYNHMTRRWIPFHRSGPDGGTDKENLLMTNTY
jgi:hypothetical protein